MKMMLMMLMMMRRRRRRRMTRRSLCEVSLSPTLILTPHPRRLSPHGYTIGVFCVCASGLDRNHASTTVIDKDMLITTSLGLRT